MKTSIYAFLALLLSVAGTIAQPSPDQYASQYLTYGQALERWDRSRAFGDPRDFFKFATDMETLHPGHGFGEAAHRDGMWIRFHARSEEIFGDATDIVLIISALAIVFGLYRFLLVPFQRAVATSEHNRVSQSPPANGRFGSNGVLGWLLVLCIWLTIIGPFLSFAKLHELNKSRTGFGALVILASLITGALLWSGRYIGYRVSIIFFWAMIGLAFFALVSGPSEETITQAVATLATSGLWLAYLGRSQRVTRTYFPGGVRSSHPTMSVLASATEFDEVLRRLAKLKDDGVLTQEEFDTKKRELLRI